jgi:hypothetical protein
LCSRRETVAARMAERDRCMRPVYKGRVHGTDGVTSDVSRRQPRLRAMAKTSTGEHGEANVISAPE